MGQGGWVARWDWGMRREGGETPIIYEVSQLSSL